MVAAEKAKAAAAQEMQTETVQAERVEETEMAQDVPEEKQLNIKTGLNNDGSCVSLILLLH